eukprot:CAMPEP_0176187604 /NCGR_PEP_ID=MMETSP0121_2-20121125/2480_1 /TAXON_ID=160619 /ORGANISM="Kryptoperidinium foliaceum, Strain CCMP 1326" /LENGTH=145 /DNA_ID=CAMNT_0017526143 /DNA_START=307 /DNA_END=741 /DNA_ORIENTATION=-
MASPSKCCNLKPAGTATAAILGASQVRTEAQPAISGGQRRVDINRPVVALLRPRVPDCLAVQVHGGGQVLCVVRDRVGAPGAVDPIDPDVLAVQLDACGVKPVRREAVAARPRHPCARGRLRDGILPPPTNGLCAAAVHRRGEAV